MKKIIFISMMFGMLPLAVEADDAVDTAAADESSVVDERHQYEGWFLGLGTHVATAGEKVEYTYPVVNNVQVYDRPMAEADHTAPRLGGSVVLGVGKRIKNTSAYGSIEIGCDFGPTTRKLEADKRSINNQAVFSRNYGIETKTSGVIPFAAIRVGHVNHNHGFLSYVKVGVAHSSSEEHSYGYRDVDNLVGGYVLTYFDSREKVSGVRPLVALGIEKGFARNATLRTELEWRGGKSKTRTWDGGDNVKVTAKDSITLRVLINYHGKLGQLWQEATSL
ncbi:MAG: hypothetical protein LBJ96_03005 [Holosporaceae bacterium]|jgi:hypothetical protein|nr:hypothetical protein [Holosporaceae bacterium]